MKLSKAQRSASTAGKALLRKKKRDGLKKILKRRKKPDRKTAKHEKVLKIAKRACKKRKSKKMNSLGVSSSSENISFSYVSPAVDSHSSLDPHAALIIDYADHSEQENLNDLTFTGSDIGSETSDAEVSVPRIKTKQKRILKRVRRGKKLSKEKRVSSETSTSSIEVVTNEDKEISVFPVNEWGLLIAVLSHPSSVKLFGSALVQVVSGTVKILGYVIDQFDSTVPVFSSSKVMCLDIKTERTESICAQVSRLQVVKSVLLQNKIPESMADRILNLCDNSSVIVAFRKNFKCSDIDYATSLMPNAFQLRGNKTYFKHLGFNLLKDDSAHLDFPQCENFITDVMSSMTEAVEKGTNVPRIVVQGDKGVGKSTFLRYAINRVLNQFGAVYYLDGDPGQSEFTPGGCVSLFKVTSPLLGPPFTHQTTSGKIYFLGTVNVQDVVDRYSTCMRLLFDHYNENSTTLPLFVNTMGWLRGVGLKLLEEIKSLVAPTHIVKIVDEDIRGHHNKFRTPYDPVNSSVKEYIYERFSTVGETNAPMHAADRRNLSILSYLGKCQKPCNDIRDIRPIECITPYCVPWKDMAFYAGDSKCSLDHIFYTFNGAWVALLSVNESLIMECDNPAMPKLLSEEPVGEDCLGFGVIRGINVAKKMFYIVTPEPEDKLKKVNAIVKGNIELPSVLLTHQESLKTDTREPFPYVTQFVGERTLYRKGVPRRKYRPKRSEYEGNI